MAAILDEISCAAAVFVADQFVVTGELVIRCDAENHPSRRAAESARYTLEGRHRRDALAPTGGLRDTLVFAMLREEYEAALPGWRGYFAES